MLRYLALVLAVLLFKSCSGCRSDEGPVPEITFQIVDKEGKSLLTEPKFTESFRIIALSEGEATDQQYGYYISTNTVDNYGWFIPSVGIDTYVFNYSDFEKDSLFLLNTDIEEGCTDRINEFQYYTNQNRKILDYDWLIENDTAVVFIK